MPLAPRCVTLRNRSSTLSDHVWSIEEIAWLLDCDRDKSGVASSMTRVPPRACAAQGEGVLLVLTLS